jgi:hypothetical protein
MSRILLPQPLDVVNLKLLLSTDDEVSDKFINACVVFLGIQSKKLAVNRESNDDYVEIPTVTLKAMLSNNSRRESYYKNVIDKLRKAGIIEVNNSYSTYNSKCKGYKFTDKYNSKFHYITHERSRGLENQVDCPEHHQHIQKFSVNTEKVAAIKSKLYYSEKAHDDLSLMGISEGDLYVIKDRYGRIHSNLTNLNKKFRGCLQAGVNAFMSLI